MTATIRRYNGADDAAELHDTHRCDRSWCSHHCEWELDTDGSISRTHTREIDGFSMDHTEVAPGDEPVSAQPTIFMPQDFVWAVSIEEVRSAVSTLNYLVGLSEREQRARAGR